VDNRLPSQAVHCTMAYKRYKEKAWKTTKELDRRHTTGFEKHRHDLGSNATNSSLSTEKAGVGMWPNVSLTRDELRSKEGLYMYVLLWIALP